MSFLSLVRKLAGGFAVALPVIASAQSGFAPLGGESAIVGALPASQSRPRLSLNAGGGYIVWQDKNRFGDRSTIMGRPLDSGLSSSLPSFRVNSSASGGHENPRVALLKNGGAAFVWQGGQFGFQHIYARFLSPSNTWIALDQLVSSSTRTYQANPNVAVLDNGNVVIVYANFNTNTMQDVSGQMYSPAGARIGSEFQINQISQFNQRAPAVTALTNGGFVVVWVSEQQRAVDAENPTSIAVTQIARPSVDIYARLFGNDGTAVNDEFLVNNGSSICAEPAVATAADGSVMMAWSSFDADADLRNNGWDIVARPFTFIGNIPQAGTQARVNTQLFGDQHSPQVSALGNNYMTVWTSLHQDGNREGIYGQFLNADGSHAGDEIRVNTTTRGMQQQPAVASDNHGRFLTVWTGPTFGPSQNDLFAQVYASSGYSPVTVANNFGSPTFVGQTTSPGKATTVGIHDPSMEPPTLDYPGVITAGGSGTPAVNAFSLAAGKYSGLFYDLNGVSSASAGYFSATVNASKGYSASLTFAGGKYSLSGKLDDLGNSGTRIITRNGGLPSLRVSFQVDLFGADQIAGTVQGGGDWNAVIHADRQVFNSKTAPSPFAGSYTLTIPGFAGGPGGTSVGTLVSGTSGTVVFKGTLANGKTVTQTSAVSKSGVWPLFALEGGGAVMMSWVDFAADPLGGELAWIKPSFKGKGFYPAGYTNGVTATVTLTSPVVSGMRQLDLNGAGLGQTLSYFISLGADGRAVTNGVALKVTPATGAFSGKVANPTTGKPAMVINGVLINGNLGEGFFLGTSESGKVTLQQP